MTAHLGQMSFLVKILIFQYNVLQRHRVEYVEYSSLFISPLVVVRNANKIRTPNSPRNLTTEAKSFVR